ncbi:MAG: single-stranded-DNA-specific exonuclease RecJ [Clostridia bacterium]|nr:single-stranded-DNA-specific exonuclease RecJ [Clostridia bacterium]
MIKDRIWAQGTYSGESVDQIIKKAGIPALLAKIFASRGIENKEEILEFLNPDMKLLHDPFLFNDMEMAVERIIRGIQKDEKITVYGDYDVDGVTSTAVIYDFLRECGADVEYYIPDRFEEGYGLSRKGVDRIKAAGTSLIITVDCGTTAFEEIDYIHQLGMEVIVTDHHECQEKLPSAYAVINPCRHDSRYPFKELAGVGVVYKLIHAICIKMGLDGAYEKYLDLVAVGTISDVVSLLGENRILARHGLQKIKNTTCVGLKVLMENCGLMEKPLSSWGISFVIAPRVNAAGRMGHAKRAVELFTTRSYDRAVEIFCDLSEDNKKRQEIEAKILEEVLATIEADEKLKSSKVFVVSGREWHHGVIGIVAAKITERYYRPCVMISVDENGIGKGSCRSIEGFDVFSALKHCESVIEAYGGHEQAAGVTIKQENIDALKELINQYADISLTEEKLIPKLKIDIAVSKEDLRIDAIRQLELLAPFGAANPSPVFLYQNLKIKSIKKVGEEKHLKLLLEDEGMFVEAIGFNMGSLAGQINLDDKIDVVSMLEINSWNSNERIQLNLKDLRSIRELNDSNNFFYSLDKSIDFLSLNDDNKYDDLIYKVRNQSFKDFQVQLDHIIPDREDMAAVFQMIRKNSVDGSLVIQDLFAFSRKVSKIENSKLNYFKLKRIFEIFDELGLMRVIPFGTDGLNITLQNVAVKKNLEHSSRFMKLQSYKNKTG